MPFGIRKIAINAVAGAVSRQTRFALPRSSTKSRPPKNRMRAGCMGLIIIIFVPLDKKAEAFRDKDQQHTRYKPVNCEKIRGFLPGEIGVLGDEEIEEKEHDKE